MKKMKLRKKFNLLNLSLIKLFKYHKVFKVLTIIKNFNEIIKHAFNVCKVLFLKSANNN